MAKLTKKEYGLLAIGLQNLLELYAELGIPKGTEKAVEEFERLRKKLLILKADEN